jgi:hypothetical protein
MFACKATPPATACLGPPRNPRPAAENAKARVLCVFSEVNRNQADAHSGADGWLLNARITFEVLLYKGTAHEFHKDTARSITQPPHAMLGAGPRRGLTLRGKNPLPPVVGSVTHQFYRVAHVRRELRIGRFISKGEVCRRRWSKMPKLSEPRRACKRKCRPGKRFDGPGL